MSFHAALFVSLLLAVFNHQPVIAVHSFPATPNQVVFESFCNYNCTYPHGPSCVPNASTNGAVAACSRTSTGSAQNMIPHSKPWNQGAFPMLVPIVAGDDDHDVIWVEGHKVRIVNGGVPQMANLTLHLEQLEYQLQSHMPNVNQTGRGVIDFERWTPAWDGCVDPSPENSWIGYQNYSITLVEKEFPQFKNNATKIRDIAKRRFERAGIRFFVETLKRLKKLRPLVAWGFYGFPRDHFSPCSNRSDFRTCGYNDKVKGPEWRAVNDQLADIWKESVALYPSIYTPWDLPNWRGDDWTLFKHGQVYSTVREAVRLSVAYGGSKDQKVYPFTIPFYADTRTVIQPVSQSDWRSTIELAWNPPKVTGVIIWQFEQAMLPTMASAIADNTLPVMVEALRAANRCSVESCAGSGWCSQLMLSNDNMTSRMREEEGNVSCVPF